MRRCCRSVHFPDLVESVLLYNNDFMKAAKKVRDLCIVDAKYANAHTLAAGVQAVDLSQRRR